MKLVTVLAASVFMVGGIFGVALAAPVPIHGVFTLIEPSTVGILGGETIYPNHSASGNSSMGLHTDFTGTLDLEAMSLELDPFLVEYNVTYLRGAPLVSLGGGMYKADMLFDWGVNTNIPVTCVWDTSFGSVSAWAPGGTSPAVSPDGYPPFGSGNGNNGNWQWAMTDGDGDGTSGNDMTTPPFPGFSVNLDFSVVPEPASLLLIAAGIAGLVGVRRKK